VRFGPVPVAEALGALLAHTHRLGPAHVLKKGRRLDAADVAALAEAGRDEVIVARPDADELLEDAVAESLAAAFTQPGSGVRVDGAKTGRSNFFAEAAGVLELDEDLLHAFNRVDEALTIGTLPPFSVVNAGEMVATLKVIPFAVKEEIVAEARATVRGGPALRVHPFRPHRAGLVLTRLPAVKEVLLDKGSEAQRRRVEAFGGELRGEIRCDHEEGAIARSLTTLREGGCDVLLCLGASAIIDRHDVLPAAIEGLGGEIVHFGMPVDPGNLLLVARLGETPVIGVPGCARSLKPSGFDKVLARVLAGLPATPEAIMRMGVGGLLKDFKARPSPRVPVDAPTGQRGAVLLAAGRSQRYGADNKLLQEIGGEAIVRRAARTLLSAGLSPVVVVTGHEAARVGAVLEGLKVERVHNPDFAEGMGTSLAKGIAALQPHGVEAAVVALGDMPWVRPEHVRRLLEAYDPAAHRLVCVPVHGGKRGHPVLWSSRFFEEMKALGGDVGARELLALHAEVVHAVPIDDGAVRVDIDTPEELAQARAEGLPE
jgi:molybdenum cofactor cytidylyltransferase